MHLNRGMDGRKCCIFLPNNRKLELTVHSKQLGKELFELAASEFKLEERDCFGLTYKTSGEHYAWVQDDKKVVDHDTEQKSTDLPLEFIFSVKFYEDSVTVHKQPSTVEIIFLHVRNLIYKEEIDVTNELSFQLAALGLQAVCGDYTSDEKASSDLKNFPCLPTKVLEGYASLEKCEEQVISLYKKFQGVTRGNAILLFMNKVEKLATYGVHYYKVKDKSRIPWWLGISSKGIYQYNFHDKATPHIVFQWRNLENLYFREKKFSVEVCSGHRRTLSTGLSTQSDQSKKNSGSNNQSPKTYTWYGSPGLIKSIWIMAIAQHQFYWDKKQSSKSKSHHANRDNASHLCDALNNNSNSLLTLPEDNSPNMQRKNVRNSEVTAKKGSKEQTPEMQAVQKKMVTDLKKRKLDLEDRLYDKVQELKEVCRQEYDITERLPIEYLRYLLPGEAKPALRRKVTTEYTVSLNPGQKRVKSGSYAHDPATAEELQQLEADCELLNQITKAAYKLAYDPSTRGRTRRKRLESYQKSLKKLQDLENRIDEVRKKQGKVPAARQSAFITATDLEMMNAMKECSLDDKSERSSLSDGMMLDDETSISSGAEALSTHSTPAFRPNSGSADVDIEELSTPRSKTPPPPKLAWFESPRGKGKRDVSSFSPNSSYAVLASPGSHRSSASHSSGTPPPGLMKRDWFKPNWEHPRHHNGWKVSSLDSLESIGSRKSNEQGTSSDVSGSPVKGHDRENANAMRIARAAESHALAHKVSLREKRGQSEPTRRMGTVNPVVEIVEGTIPEDGKDSRTSLTDSGHVSSSESRLQAGQDEDGPRSQNSASDPMRRDISDSSLSELSTQSNPATLPSSGHHPKFYPFCMSSRSRAQTHAEPSRNSKAADTMQSQQGHTRKRSSSFTESGSNAPKVTLRRENHRTLSRSKTHHEGDTSTQSPGIQAPDEHTQFQPYPSGDIGKEHLSANHSSNDLPPPMFDTNLNICRQYLSGSQGQLTQNSINMVQQTQNIEQYGGVAEQNTLAGNYKPTLTEQTWSDVTASNPANVHRYKANLSVNNSNNKLNFGQIYQMSQDRRIPEVKRFNSQPNHLTDQNTILRGGPSNRNVPKCNSLDSILDSGRPTDHSTNQDTLKNYALEPQNPVAVHRNYPQYQAAYTQPGHYTVDRNKRMPQHVAEEEPMTNSDRDKFNNEAFEEIRGMGWVPSLDDYGSRASVAESLPAKSKKEDIMQLLQQHITQHWRPPKRTPSTSSSATLQKRAESKLRAKIRAEMKERVQQGDRQSDTYSIKGQDANVNTWEGYKRNINMQTLKRNQNRPAEAGQAGNPVNIFRHNPPPPPRQVQGTVRRQTNYYESGTSQPGQHQQYQQSTIQRQVHKGYVNQNGYVIPIPSNGDVRNQSDHNFYNQPQKTAGYRYQVKQQQTAQHRQTVSSMQQQRNQSGDQQHVPNDRSLSETWNKQNLVPVKNPQHHSPIVDHAHHVYPHLGHHGMVPIGGTDRSREAPRRTASADDLLWSPPGDQNSFTIGNQQGTLV